MFCGNCGAPAADGADRCEKCGRMLMAAPQVTAVARKQTGDALKDALSVARLVLVDPAGALKPTYDRLGEAKATATGVALCVLFAVAVAVGAKLATREGFVAFLGSGIVGDGVDGLLRVLLGALVIPAALVAVSRGLRLMLGGEVRRGAEFFATGAALTPLGITAIAAGLLGFGNVEVIGLLAFFAWVYLVLMLFVGLTQLGGLSLRQAAPAVPVLLVVSAWLSKVVFVALF